MHFILDDDRLKQKISTNKVISSGCEIVKNYASLFSINWNNRSSPNWHHKDDNDNDDEMASKRKIVYSKYQKLQRQRAQRSTLHSWNTFVISRSAFTELNSSLRFLLSWMTTHKYTYLRLSILMLTFMEGWLYDCRASRLLGFSTSLRVF